MLVYSQNSIKLCKQRAGKEARGQQGDNRASFGIAIIKKHKEKGNKKERNINRRSKNGG